MLGCVNHESECLMSSSNGKIEGKVTAKALDETNQYCLKEKSKQKVREKEAGSIFPGAGNARNE